MPGVTIIEAPQLGVNETTATVVEWYIADGAEASVGEPVCALETAKAVFDVVADAPGYLIHLVSAGSEVDVSQPIALVGTDLTQLREEKGSYRAPRPEETTGAGTGKATRKAVEAAQRLGVDLAEVVPSGVFVSESDVLRHGAALGQHRSTVTDVSWNPEDQPVVIYGAGPGAATLKECLDLGGRSRVVCFVDDAASHPATLCELPVLDSALLGQLVERGVQKLACEIGNGAVRLRIRQRARDLGLELINVIHPAAYVAPSARLGVGNYVKAGAIVETNTVVGDCCIIDNGVVIAHDNSIGEGCHIAPGVAMGSGITVGVLAVVGTGASVATGVHVGKSAIVGPGSGVVKDVPDLAVVEGVPARVVGQRRGFEASGVGDTNAIAGHRTGTPG